MENVNCSITEVDAITRDLSVEIAKTRVEKEFAVVVKDTAKKAHLKGFRPGKAPASVVMQLLGDRIKGDVAMKLISEALEGLYKEHELKVVGQPEITLEKIEPTSELGFKARVYLVPEPKIDNYKKRKIKVLKRSLDDKAVTDSIEKLRESRAELKTPEGRDISEKGDVIALTLTVKDAGSDEIPTSEPFVGEIGEGKLPEAVEKALIGKKVGDAVDVTTVLPDDYAKEDLRGKEAQFLATVDGIFVKKLPELNDEFAKKAGIQAETVAELTAKMKERMGREFVEMEKSESQDAILTLLADENPFPVPQAMVDEEIRMMLMRFGAVRQDPWKMNIAPFRSALGEVAEKRVRCTVIMDRLAEQEQVQVNDEDKEKMFRELAEQTGGTLESTKEMIASRGNMEGMYAEIKRSKVLEQLVGWCDVEYTDAPSPEEGEKAA